jgi:hypothetical protein
VAKAHYIVEISQGEKEKAFESLKAALFYLEE